jgi:hypothetical protein
MIRFTKVLALAATLLIVPSIASAVGITIVNVTGDGADGVLDAGGTVTFDLRLTTDATPLYGLGVSVTGYDLPGANFDRELGIAFQSATVVNHAFGIDIGSGPEFGIDNQTTGEEIFAINQFTPQAYTTSLFEGVGVTAAAGDGSADLGINGAAAHPSGDIHFQVTFSNVGVLVNRTYATLSFDVLSVYAGGTNSTSSATFALTVIPEPGTALLMGLGLAGLAANRRH